MTDPVLYDYWRSSASYRVRIALNLAGLGYRAIPVDLRHGAQGRPDHRARNPQGLVPVLEIDGTTLTQSLAQRRDILRSRLGRRARELHREARGAEGPHLGVSPPDLPLRIALPVGVLGVPDGNAGATGLVDQVPDHLDGGLRVRVVQGAVRVGEVVLHVDDEEDAPRRVDGQPVGDVVLGDFHGLWHRPAGPGRGHEQRRVRTE